MTTSALYRPPRPTISFELYPPRTPAGEEQATETISRLAALRPDYFSVTYGASGLTATTSPALVRHILDTTDVTVLAHLTCVGLTADRARSIVESFLDAGVRDFLALRGDPPTGVPDWQPRPGELGRASDLVGLIRDVERERFGVLSPLARLAARDAGHPAGVSIAVAAYPGIATRDGRFAVREQDLLALRAKQDAGADFAITQVFFDPAAYVELQRAALAAGIHIPLVPGVLPLTDPRRVRRLCELNHLPLPDGVLAHLEGAPSPDAAYQRGLAATLDLVRGVLDAGAPGLHLYTFNRHETATSLLAEVIGLRPAAEPAAHASASAT